MKRNAPTTTIRLGSADGEPAAWLRVQKLPPRRGYRLVHEVSKAIGPIVFGLMGKPVKIGGEVHEMSAVMQTPELSIVFLRDCLQHMIETSPDEVFATMAKVFAGCAWLEVHDLDEGQGRAFGEDLDEVEAMFDEVFVDHVEMASTFYEVLRFQFGPTFPVRFTFAG